jgi:hypothetical protein
MTEDDERVLAAAERDLERLLSVEPSPDFAARVRDRISDEAARRWTAGWWLPAAAAAAAFVVALAVTLPQSTVVPDRSIARPSIGRDVSLPTSNPAPPRIAPSSRPVARTGVETASRLGSRHAPATPAEPLEVLVPTDQTRALARLVEMARTRAVDADAFAFHAQQVTGNDSEQAVAPIVVDELDVSLIAVEGGEGEDKTETTDPSSTVNRPTRSTS